MSEVAQKRLPLPINPRMLRWAREQADCSAHEAARHVGVTEAKLIGWEAVEPEGAPTVRQARKLADFYHRSFMEFFRADPPDIPAPELIPDFRLYHDADAEKHARALASVQIWAETQRTSAFDLYSEIGEEPSAVPKQMFASVEHNPEDVAARARVIMSFPIEQQIGLGANERYQLPTIIRNKIESLGILTLRRSDLTHMGARGFCIAEFPLPVIVFGNEAPSAQSFTLVHELAHVFLRQSAISGPIPRAGGHQPIRQVEEWCNSFSAAFLLPRAQVQSRLKPPQEPLATFSDHALNELAAFFGVSPHAMLIRLVELRYVQASYYWDVKRPEFLEAEASYKTFARSKYYGSRYRGSLGDLYTALVVEAWTSGRITNHQAAEFMGIKNLAHLKDIRENFEM